MTTTRKTHPGLRFLADPKSHVPADTRIARLAGVRGKEAVLEALARALAFPDWTGHNWDALDEQLRDLSWLEEQRVAILHEQLPHLGTELRTYLEILRDAVQEHAAAGDRVLEVVFPASTEKEIRRLLEAG